MTFDDNQKYLLCTLCHRPTPQGKDYCQYCWTRLISDKTVNATEAAVIYRRVEASLKRKKIIRRISLITGSVIILAGITLGLLINKTDLFDPPLPALNSYTVGQWAMFHHDPLHSGSSESNYTLPKGQLQWTFTTGGSIKSSPAVVDGIVYFGSNDGKIYAVNADTGAEIWHVQTESFVQSSPAVVDGVVYAGSNDGRLFAINAKTGERIWTFRTPYTITASPAVAGGMVFFGADDSKIYALDALTGAERWEFTMGGQPGSSLVIVKGILYVGSYDRSLYALNAKDGKFRLHFDSFAIGTGPAVRGSTVYFTNLTGSLFAIDGEARNWPNEYQIKPFWTQLWAMHLAPQPPKVSGLLWGEKLGIRCESSPAILNNTLYAGIDSRLVAYDLGSNSTLWTFKTGDEIATTPAIAGHVVYFGSDDGHVYAVDADSGKELWNVQTGDKVASSPAVANNMLYFGSDDGKLYAIK